MFFIVLLAMVAGFLALRLYSVLGKRTGHEQVLPRAAEVPAATAPRLADTMVEAKVAAPKPVDAGAEAGLRAIVAAEPGFDVTRFAEGAQAAYRLTLEAFWKGDEAALADLVTDDVRAHFAEAIAARVAAGETLDNRLVSIERATIIEASVGANRAGRIVVRFDADIAAVTRDADGVVIAGSLTDAVETHDLWTFARTLKSADPNWKLADTDEA
ncbi:Tim44/TimA family putative adaptor protein [Sphingomonas bacterium]|uniref:Tim44/TimA family putative adaptor protein n=1 Tax=Sphingomonas bacterium TaxID=1895847 RepID=UPI001576EC85|nr:Tim44/TimA family putative adaptor protein [Sphingomonas bacterium]